MKKLKIYLADLRHIRDGILFADTMPLGIAYMKAVIDRDLADLADCEIFAYADDFREKIINNPPDVVMVTNYMWNVSLSMWYLDFVKKINPNVLTVMGGPNIPIEVERQKEFVKAYPYLDLYALGEGDYLACDIAKLFLEHDCDIEKLKRSNALKSCIYSLDGDMIVGDVYKRSKFLDDIPSPWLTGIMDKFFDSRLTPLIETNRGCPFACTFCVQGTKFYTKVSYFGLERLRDEIFYIAKMITTKSPTVRILRFADPNFGMYERDIEIARFMGETQKMYEYPTFIDATTGKNKPERVIKAMEEVSGALIMWQAVQSLDDLVLTNVKRENIKIDTYHQINVYLKGRGLRSQADVILCLPGETLKSHLKGLEDLANSGVLRFNNFQAMLLKGSEIETIESRKKFGFEAKHRLIQKNFSIHNGEKIYETEEIIVSTESFSFEEYIIARKYHLIINMFMNELRFEKLLNFFDNINISRWDWIHQMYISLDSFPLLKHIFQGFVTDTKNELFESVEELERFYNIPENYEQLEKGEIGDNVVHKYRVSHNYINWGEICDFAYSAARTLIEKSRPDIASIEEFATFWENLVRYQFHSSAHGKSKDEILADSYAEFTYKIKDWFADDMPTSFEKYHLDTAITYYFSLPHEHRKNLEASLSRWNNKTDLVTMSLVARKIKENWLWKDTVNELSENLQPATHN
jgi:radical SAM superfamily enzyme YgiQ (UPF0313 family)